MRRGNGFNIVSGLITRQEYAALDNKIQLIAWKDNLLQKYLFGIFDFKLKQAGSVAINSKKAISIPGINQGHINQIIANHIPGLDLDIMELTAVHIKMLYRKLIYLAMFTIPVLTFLLFYGLYKPFFIFLAFTVYLLITMIKRYRKTKYAIGQDVVMITGGTFGDERALLKDYKNPSS